MNTERALHHYGKLGYLALSLVLIALNVHFSIHERWIADFWVFVGLLQEISKNPLHPGNPFIVGVPPNIPYMPYLLGVSFFGEAFQLSFEQALAILGVINLSLFLYFFRKFLLPLLGGEFAVFLSLCAVLLLWGSHPWLVSGFFHLRTLFYVTPYPSTFAIALSFICFSLYLSFQAKQQWKSFVLLFALSITIALTHPLSFLFTAGGLLALTVRKFQLHNWESYLPILVVLALSLGAAAVWPYFPLFTAVSDATYAADPGTVVLYYRVLPRIWPALIGLPFLLYRLKRDIRDPFVWMFIGFAGLYSYGIARESWSYGRIIASAVMVLQIVLASATSEFISFILRWTREATTKIVLPTIIVAMMAITIVTYRYGYGEKSNETAKKYSFLERFTERDEVVLATQETSLFPPVFGRKVVVYPRPSFVGPSYEERVNDIQHFFELQSSRDMRREILKKYQVEYVLITEDHLTGEMSLPRSVATELGEILFENNEALLIQIPSAERKP